MSVVITEEKRDIVFLFNLVQDVNILRGLAQLVRKEFGAEIRLSFLVSARFAKRDGLGVWGPELNRLAKDLDAQLAPFASAAEALALFKGRGGVIIAGSESHLDAHHETRDIFRAAPAGFLTLTLQHGLECIGFRQSREHVMAHGLGITFAADLICAWQPEERLTALTASERPKLRVTGPPTLLNQRQPHPDHPPLAGGLICENLHSVRLHASGNHRGSFMEIFNAFCAHLGARGEEVTLRPHPGGQYVLRNQVPLPDNVRLNTLPIYHVDLAGYAYGISAPSTILLDMVLAGLPTAVWCDTEGVMDASAYDGLAVISDLQDWLAFLRDVDLRRAALLARQEAYLARLGIERDPKVIAQRFLRLIRAGLETHHAPLRPAPGAVPSARDQVRVKVLVLTDPGGKAPEIGDWAEVTHLTDTLAVRGGRVHAAPACGAWLRDQLAEAAPDLIVITGWRGQDLSVLQGPAPVLLVADAPFVAGLQRAQPRGAGAALLNAADLVLLTRPEDRAHLTRAGCPERKLYRGTLTAALARCVSMGRADA